MQSEVFVNENIDSDSDFDPLEVLDHVQLDDILSDSEHSTSSGSDHSKVVDFDLYKTRVMEDLGKFL